MTIAQLAAEIRIGPPSLYAAFGDKRALFEEAAARYAQRSAAVLAADLGVADVRVAVRRVLTSARRDPTAWRIADPADPGDVSAAAGPGIPSTIGRLYLDLPLVDGVPMRADHPALAGLPRTPWTCSVIPNRRPPA